MTKRYYHPSTHEIKLMRQHGSEIASRWSAAPQFRFDIGVRCRTDGAVPASMNVLLLTDDPSWADTDLFNYRDWKEIRAVPVTEDGHALVDVYVYERFGEKALVCNIQFEFEKEGLVAIHSDEDRNLWVRRFKKAADNGNESHNNNRPQMAATSLSWGRS